MRKQQSGFTLIELVIVIILLGIITASVTPQFVDLQTNARQAVIDAGAGALQSSALIALAANSGGTSSFATILASTDGVGAGEDVVVTVSACAFTLEHTDDPGGITATGTIPASLCT